MKKQLLTFLLLAILSTGNALAQKKHTDPITYQLASSSVDSTADAKAIARMRHKMDSIRKHRPTVALVLAGGGAKGAAHVGALEYIEELGIPIDMVLGTSMGGLVGGLVSMGYPAKTIDTILSSTNWSLMLSDKVPIDKMSYLRRRYNEIYPLRIPFYYEDNEWKHHTNESSSTFKTNEKPLHTVTSEVGEQYTANFIANLPDGYLYGYNVYNIINSLTVGYQDSMDFSDLPIPYCCVATDLVEMRAKYWTSGHLADAMRSTMAIPFYFTPVRTDSCILVDGGTRNNFPTDMARAMGADYIIGIDLSQPRKYSDINGLTPLLMQCINLMGKDAFDNNRALADVYIHPNMSGMNMMSFDSESIAECVQRGYTAAVEQKDKLQQIRQHLGPHTTRHLNAPQATNINNQKVLIGSLQYENLNPDFALHFSNMTGIHANEKYNRQDIEDEMALMYGTGLFDQLSYSILGRSEPYTLLFHCKIGPVHQFGAGLHFDTKNMLSASFNIGFNKRKPSGFMADITAVIGNSSSATLDLRYTTLKGPAFGLMLHTKYQKIDQYSAQQRIVEGLNSLTLWHNTADLYCFTHSWRDGTIRFGFQYLVSPFERITAFYPSVEYEIRFDTIYSGDSYTIDTVTITDLVNRTWDGFRTDSVNNWSHFVLSPYIEVIYDNTDDSYFPSKGINAHFRYDYYIYCYPLYNYLEHATEQIFNKSHNVNAHIKAAIPVTPSFTILPSLWFHSNVEIFEGKIYSSQIPSWLESYIGGITPKRFYANQLPYIGYNMPHFISYSHAESVANIDFQWQIAPKNYIAFTAAAYSTFVQGINREDAKRLHINSITDYAFALQLGHQSIIGPLLFNVHWSRYNQPSHWGVYLSAGFEF